MWRLTDDTVGRHFRVRESADDTGRSIFTGGSRLATPWRRFFKRERLKTSCLKGRPVVSVSGPRADASDIYETGRNGSSSGMRRMLGRNGSSSPNSNRQRLTMYQKPPAGLPAYL